MTLIATVSDLLDDPQGVISGASVRDLGRAGLFGYGLGAFSLYMFLRLFSAVPPGAYSFLNLLLMGLGINFFFAAGIHLFLEMTGVQGGALRLFFLFGLTEFFLALLIPLGFLANLDYLNPAADLFLCFIIIIVARVSLIRRLYSISRNKALLSIAMPYAAVLTGFFMVLIYAIVYAVWLIV